MVLKLETTDIAYNNSGDTFIYLAFADTPFKYSGMPSADFAANDTGGLVGNGCGSSTKLSLQPSPSPRIRLWTGNASVLGAVAKGSGVVRHRNDPLDPKNMLLYHSFVENLPMWMGCLRWHR